MLPCTVVLLLFVVCFFFVRSRTTGGRASESSSGEKVQTDSAGFPHRLCLCIKLSVNKYQRVDEAIVNCSQLPPVSSLQRQEIISLSNCGVPGLPRKSLDLPVCGFGKNGQHFKIKDNFRGLESVCVSVFPPLILANTS